MGKLIATTGYRLQDGWNGLFSVWIAFGEKQDLDQRDGALVRLYALAPAMESKLPDVGTTFIVTDGSTPVAECFILERRSDPQGDT